MPRTLHEWYAKTRDRSVPGVASELEGKTIAPPHSERGMYNRSEYKIVKVDRGKVSGRMRIQVSPPITKAGEGTISRFYPNADPDSVWCKFLLKETTSINSMSSGSLTPIEVAALNNVRSRAGNNTCVSCGKPLVPLFGTLYGCPGCEK